MIYVMYNTATESFIDINLDGLCSFRDEIGNFRCFCYPEDVMIDFIKFCNNTKVKFTFKDEFMLGRAFIRQHGLSNFVAVRITNYAQLDWDDTKAIGNA